MVETPLVSILCYRLIYNNADRRRYFNWLRSAGVSNLFWGICCGFYFDCISRANHFPWDRSKEESKSG